MIKPVTYQGVFNFAANLYALEVKSRFIDQNNANGYYKGYGNELAATIVGQQIQIGTGAFVVQGRMNEVTATETVSPQIFDGFVGYVVARVETYHPSDTENCTFVAYVNRSFDAIVLQKDDIYAANADNTNKVYELPIYSFAISGTTITNLQKLIGAVDDYAKIKAIVDNALATAQSVVQTATQAVSTANAANTTAQAAEGKADNAVSAASQAVSTANAANTTAQAAEDKADNAVSVAGQATETAGNALNVANGIDGKAQSALDTANGAVATVNEQHEQMTEEIAELAAAIVKGQGTVVEVGGEQLAVYDATNAANTDDDIVISGGGV